MRRERYEGATPDKEQAMEKISRFAEIELEESGNTPINPQDFAGEYRSDYDPKDATVEFPGAENLTRKALHDMLAATAEKNESFGKAFVRNTSNFDKKKNKVDMVAEYTEDENASLHMGIEIGSGDFGRKFAEIFEGIAAGELSDVKYFRPENNDKKIKLGNIPRVVVAAGRDTVYDAGSDLLDGEKTGKNLSDHYLQYLTLVEAEMQLRLFAKYARKMGRVDSAKTLDAMHLKIETALNEKIKKSGPVPKKDLEKDRMFVQMRLDLAKEFARVHGVERAA